MSALRHIAAAIFVACLSAPAQAQSSRSEIETIVKEYLAAHPEDVRQIVKDYLAKNPEVLQQAFGELLRKRMPAANANTDKAAAIKSNAAALFSSTHQVNLGNHTGRQTVLAVWNIADTTNAFYACIDLQVS